MLTQYIEEAKKNLDKIILGEKGGIYMPPQTYKNIKSFLESELTALHDKVREEIALELEKNGNKVKMYCDCKCNRSVSSKSTYISVVDSASIARGK